MNRRDLLLGASSAALLLPVAARAAGAWVAYTPGLVKERLSAGETVFLDVAADWCATCRSQERTINAFLDQNPDYAANITFVRLDWDDHKRSDIVAELDIPRRSTLVVLKGEEELGRIVANTRPEVIRDLMNVALTAAVA